MSPRSNIRSMLRRLPLTIAIGVALGIVVPNLIRSASSPARAGAPEGDRATANAGSPGKWSKEAMTDWKKPAGDELRSRLSDLEFEVTQNEATEAPFRNAYWNNKEAGLYVDVVSGEPLFSSLDKYDSGTGWPSFLRPLADGNLIENTDHKLGYARTEVRSKVAGSHLGHVFPDGPKPTGMRYCINSAALRFVPVERLAEEGYETYAEAFRRAGYAVPAAAANALADVSGGDAAPTATETAILAGGCFWGMEDLIRDIPGVLDTEVGYSGGDYPNAEYKDVKRGNTGHAESVKVVFDPKRLEYATLLDWFFRMHDPTTKDRQGNDRGSQYRSAIFFADEAQRKTAERVKAEWEASGRWKRPIVTEIAPAGPFWKAEPEHQDYLEHYPNGYTCHFLREFES